MKNPRFSLTPEVKVELDLLFAKFGDQVHAEQLVDAAKHKDSPLHDLFPWDDKACGHELRKQIAARILRSYHVVRFRIVTTGETTRPRVDIPYAVKVRPAPEEPKVWTRTQIALKNEFSREQLIAERIAWVRRGIRQLLVVPELKDLHDQLSAVIDKYSTGEAKKAAP